MDCGLLRIARRLICAGRLGRRGARNLRIWRRRRVRDRFQPRSDGGGRIRQQNRCTWSAVSPTWMKFRDLSQKKAKKCCASPSRPSPSERRGFGRCRRHSR
eukprot:5823823-Prymnesium_polylepis.1